MLNSIFHPRLAALLALALPVLAQEPTPLLTKTEPQLLEVLKAPNSTRKDKADACLELAVIGTKNAVPALAALLPDPEMNHMARYALETIADPSVDEAFRAQLTQLKGRPLVGVIGSIGVRHDAKATTALAGLLSHADPDVAQAAARALGRLGSEEAVMALMSEVGQVDPDNLIAFCEGIARGIDSLLAAGKRQLVTEICVNYNNTALPHQVRSAALRGAFLAAGDEGPSLLAGVLSDPEYTLFATAVRISQDTAGPAITKVLTTALPTLPEDRQVVVLQTLGLRADPAGLPAITDLTKASAKPVRLAAVRALPMLGSAATVSTLAGLAADADRDVAEAAQNGLVSLAGKEAETAILELMASPDAARRELGLELVGKRRMTGALPTVLKATGDDDSAVRVAAIRRVGELGDDAEIGTLSGVLANARNPQEIAATEQAISALAVRQKNPAAAVATLRPRLAQLDAAKASALLRVLGAVGGAESLEVVRSALGSQDAVLRGEAIRVLSDWRTADAAPDLLALATSAGNPTDKLLGLRGYLGFASNPDLPVDQRLTIVREAAPLVAKAEEKKLLLSALGSIKHPAAVELIVPHLQSADTKDEAVAALVAVADELLKRNDASAGTIAANLVGPLQAAGNVPTNADLAKRVKTLTERAQSKAK